MANGKGRCRNASVDVVTLDGDSDRPKGGGSFVSGLAIKALISGESNDRLVK